MKTFLPYIFCPYGQSLGPQLLLDGRAGLQWKVYKRNLAFQKFNKKPPKTNFNTEYELRLHY